MPGKNNRMIFVWVIVAIAATGLLVSLFWGDSTPSEFSDNGPRLAFNGVLLVALLSSLAMARPKMGEVGRAVLLWGGLGLVLVAGYAYKSELTAVGNRTLAVLMPGYAVTDTAGKGSVTLYRQDATHFTVIVQINGRTIPMLVDTGASGIVLTQRDARAVGIDTANLVYSVPISTANGPGRAARATIRSVEVGSIRKTDFRAFVMPAGKLSASLLGMDFLNRLSRWEVRGDRMILYP